VLASIFRQVSERVKGTIQNEEGVSKPVTPDLQDILSEDAPRSGMFKENLSPNDVEEWLENARLAQHVYLKERGHYAKRWEQLDQVSDYHFLERMKLAKNIRVHPIELESDEREFHLTLEGTSGDLMGEKFVMDLTGSMRQVRYTEALIHQLQEGTNLLESAFRINPVEESEQAPKEGRQ
jgi:hypothetical protein